MVKCSCNPSSQKAGAGGLLSSKPVCLRNEREEGMKAKEAGWGGGVGRDREGVVKIHLIYLHSMIE